jgi:hypothetical protein
VRVFTLDPAVAARARRIQLVIVGAMMLAALAAVLGPRVLAAGKVDGVSLAVGVAALAAAVLSLRRRGALPQVELEDDAIAMRSGPIHVRIPRAEVRAIEELPGGRLRVRGARRYDDIVLGTGLAGFEDLRATLASWTAFTPVTRDPAPRTRALLFATIFVVPAATGLLLHFGGAAAFPVLGAVLAGCWLLLRPYLRGRVFPRFVTVLLLVGLIVAVVGFYQWFARA